MTTPTAPVYGKFAAIYGVAYHFVDFSDQAAYLTDVIGTRQNGHARAHSVHAMTLHGLVDDETAILSA